MAFQFNFSIDNRAEQTPEALEGGNSQKEMRKDSLVFLDAPESLIENRKNVSSEENQLNQEFLSETHAHMTDHQSSLNKCDDLTLPDKYFCPTDVKEHNIPQDVSKVLENKVVETLPGLCHANISVVKAEFTDYFHGDKILTKSISSHSDLITGVYEGGLKIWECTFDLMDYFLEAEIQFVQKVVLDLGCGAGLLGITALKRNAEKVHFQDYNDMVIDKITLPNVLVNCICQNKGSGGINDALKKCEERNFNQGLISKCKFFSGDWSGFSKFLLNSDTPIAKYDVILTSETIYNPDYYEALHDILSKLLKANGCVYLASKAHYFGCGGGVLLFTEFVEKKNVFKSRSVKVIDKGLKRFIIELVFKNPVH